MIEIDFSMISIEYQLTNISIIANGISISHLLVSEKTHESMTHFLHGDP